VASNVLEQRKRQGLVGQQKIPPSPLSAESEVELELGVNALTRTHMTVADGLKLDSVPIQITFTT